MPVDRKTFDIALPQVKPEEVGVYSDRLEKIKPFMQVYIDQKKAPNLLLLAARNGKLIYHEALGYLDFEGRKPAGKDTIFRLFSNTKPITGVAAMICVEEGLFRLDDPVSRYLPSFKNQRVRISSARGPGAGLRTVPANREITLRDCLRNTTGLASAVNAPVLYLSQFRDLVAKTGIFPSAEQSGSLKESVENLGRLPLESQPGSSFEYHVGFPVAGVIMEMVTGKSLEDFYQERIFQPLGMLDSSFYLDKSKLDRFPALYRAVKEKGLWKLALQEKPEDNPSLKVDKPDCEAGGGGGGVLTTASDYARFFQMLLNRGTLDGVQILSRKSVEIMTTNHLGDIKIDIPGPNYGFGIGTGVYNGGTPPAYRSPGSFGWNGAAGTECFVDPQEQLVVLCFSQVVGHHALEDNYYQEDFERLVYQALV